MGLAVDPCPESGPAAGGGSRDGRQRTSRLRCDRAQATTGIRAAGGSGANILTPGQWRRAWGSV